MNVKEIKEGAASVKTKEEKPPVKTKKMTKPEDKPAPKMVLKQRRSWDEVHGGAHH
jgi:hypothetical protein